MAIGTSGRNELSAPPRERRRPRRFAHPAEPALLIEGPEGERRVPVPVGWSRIGRSPAAEIRVDDPGASRRHALLVRRRGEKLQIIDDRSLSGTYVNGRPVNWATLNDGDEVEIGAVTLTVRAGEGPSRSN